MTSTPPAGLRACLAAGPDPGSPERAFAAIVVNRGREVSVAPLCQFLSKRDNMARRDPLERWAAADQVARSGADGAITRHG
jgi:hypothetical protein